MRTQDGAAAARPWVRLAGPLALAAAGLLLPALGCGTGADDLQPVHGRVYYRGAPLTAGTIVFTPDPERGGAGPLASAEIDAEGHYSLRTDGRFGAVAGWHRVTVVSLEAPAAGADGAEVTVRSVLPAHYRDPDLSGLLREVKAGGDNTLDFNLD